PRTYAQPVCQEGDTVNLPEPAELRQRAGWHWGFFRGRCEKPTTANRVPAGPPATTAQRTGLERRVRRARREVFRSVSSLRPPNPAFDRSVTHTTAVSVATTAFTWPGLHALRCRRRSDRRRAFRSPVPLAYT